MRVLLMLRGSAGCGKSTWIEQNGLKPYTLSADDIRLLCQSPIQQPDGSERIASDNDGLVWKLLFQILERRLSKGEFTCIDATNTTTAEMNRYKELGNEYKYRLYCVDFTSVSIEEAKRRNAGREPYKRVPEAVIDKMYSSFAVHKIPSGFKVIKPEELDSVWLKRIDLSDYKKIHHIGDIHGCYSALKKYIDENGGIKEDEFYIFVGDYLDRGLENAEVMNYLLSIMDRKNVLFLEGNHEKSLQTWSHEGHGKSREFELVTRRQLEEAKVDKKAVSQFYRKGGQCAYYQYDDKVIFASHAGISRIPNNLTFVSADQMINGVGEYDDYEEVSETFYQTMPDHFYQIYGHRNSRHLPVQINDRVFNLEGQVEEGGALRIVRLSHDGFETTEIPNEVFRPHETPEPSVLDSPLAEVIMAFRKNKLIQEKQFGNISSFNFTRQAFSDRKWNDQTVKARGLYIDTVKGKVAARGYEKFFNIDERPETRFNKLANNLKFPVTVYVKENGFLGLVSYNEYEDDLLVASKSMLDGQYAGWVREMLYRAMDGDKIQKLKEYVKENQVTFVFECVDMVHDPHVIEYPESGLYLLAIIRNEMEFGQYGYAEMCRVAEEFGLTPKEKAFVIGNWQDFYEFYHKVTAEDYTYKGRIIEGFVIEDSSGFMVKLKLAYYNFWKKMRAMAQEIIKKGRLRDMSVLTTAAAYDFYAWIKKLNETEEEIPRDICTLRRMFYESGGFEK